MQRDGARQWLPRAFVRRSAVMDFDKFCLVYPFTDFLLVRLNKTPEVRSALERASLLADDAQPGLRDLTVQGPPITETSAADDPGELSAHVTRSVQQIARRLSHWDICVVPIEKRVQNGFDEKVSLGRTPNNDVVLRHRSVSQFHAWFSREDAGHLLIRDGGSKNGTFVNGEPLSGSKRIKSGDTLAFGRVEGMVCAATALWALLRSLGD